MNTIYRQVSLKVGCNTTLVLKFFMSTRNRRICKKSRDCFGYCTDGGFPGSSAGKESACRRLRFDPWVGKIPWRRAWQPTPVFLPGESHGQRSLMGYGPCGCQESNMTESTWYELYRCLQHLNIKGVGEG